jgi:hypothetical protein
VTLELLHLEYLEHQPDGYRYTRFCDLAPPTLAETQFKLGRFLSASGRGTSTSMPPRYGLMHPDSGISEFGRGQSGIGILAWLIVMP